MSAVSARTSAAEMPGVLLVCVLAAMSRFSDWRVLRIGTCLSILAAGLLLLPVPWAGAVALITFWSLAAMAVSAYLLSVAVKALPVGTAYAVWTGIGTMSTAVFGMIFFHEPTTVARVCCILLVVSGIVGLVILER